MRGVDRVANALAERAGPTWSWLVGEPCFAPPPKLAEAMSRAAQASSFGYPPIAGLPSLRRVLAARHREGDSAVPPERVVVTNGAKGGLLALFATLLEPGDELIHPGPCYPAYPTVAARFGARPVAVPETNGGFAGWSDAVASRIGPKTRAVVVASPSNPTGSTLGATAAKELVDLCRSRDIRLVCDEAYADFRYGSDRHAAPADFDPERETVIQVRSISKSWALCGWRIGWIVADASLVAAVARTHAALINPASGPAQTALCALPEVPATYLDSARRSVDDRMSHLTEALQHAGFAADKPAGGFYVWLDVMRQIEAAGMNDTMSWCEAIARRDGVGVWPGGDFGGEGYIRIAVTAPSDDLWPTAVRNLAAALTRQM